MSLAITPLKTVQVKDPLIRVNEQRLFPVLKSGSRVSYKQIRSTSYSNSSAQFTAPPPSPMIFVDRRVEVKMTVNVKFTGTAPLGQNLLQSGFSAFRAYPISSITDVLAVTINNNSSSINMSDVIQPLLRYNTGRDLIQGHYSTTPNMLDTYQRYDSGAGTIINPLAQYADNPYQTPRGGFPITILSNTNNSAEIEADLTEPIFLSPFLFGEKAKPGFLGVQNMDFNFSFSSNLGRIWSHSDAGGSLLSSIEVTINNPTLLFKYVTPKELQSIPRSIVYSYYTVQRYPTDIPNGTSIVPNGITTISSNNIQLQSIPRRMYIMARQRNSLQTYLTTDTYMGITGISVNWNNNSGLLSSASQQDLYNISSKNGFQGSYAQWSGGPVQRMLGGTNTPLGTVGSVLCLEFGTDIGLGDLECPGMLGTYQLQMNVNLVNVNQTDSISPTLYVIVVNEGTFTIMDNRSIAQIGVVSKQDVLDSATSPQVDYESLDDMYGGNFFSGLKDVAGKVYRGVKDAMPYIEKGVEIGSKVAPYVAPLLMAAGDDYYQDEKDRKDEARAMKAYWDAKGGKRQTKKGGVLVGGKKLTRAQLQRRLK